MQQGWHGFKVSCPMCVVEKQLTYEPTWGELRNGMCLRASSIAPSSSSEEACASNSSHQPLIEASCKSLAWSPWDSTQTRPLQAWLHQINLRRTCAPKSVSRLPAPAAKVHRTCATAPCMPSLDPLASRFGTSQVESARFWLGWVGMAFGARGVA